MDKLRILSISQEIVPYSPETHLATIGRNLPESLLKKEHEIRVFMPRFGKINQRRHQLHEVIRLSGMNMIVDDTDHPLIIKVASLQPSRMQVYFIENEEYFQRRFYTEDEDGYIFPDSDERMIFFCRGVLETCKKLGWAPDIIHCHGWMTALVPMYLKRIFEDEPLFEISKTVYSAYSNNFKGELNETFAKKVQFDDEVDAEDTELILDPSFDNLNKLGLAYADGVALGDEGVTEEIKAFMKNLNKPSLDYQGLEANVEIYEDFYNTVLENDSVLAD